MWLFERRDLLVETFGSEFKAEFAEGAEHLILQEFAESAEKWAESLRVLGDLL